MSVLISVCSEGCCAVTITAYIHNVHVCSYTHTYTEAHAYTHTQRHTYAHRETHQSVPVHPLRYTLQLVNDQYFQQQQQIECLLTPFSPLLTLFSFFLKLHRPVKYQIQNTTSFQVIASKIWSVLCAL